MALSNDLVQQAIADMYQKQLGRNPDPESLTWYANQVAEGNKSLDQINAELDRSTEGYNYDAQVLNSEYRQQFGRNMDPEGLAYYMGLEDVNAGGISSLADQIAAGARGADVAAAGAAPQGGYTNLNLAALEADPYGGYYAGYNPYYFGEVPADAENVSTTQAGQKIQWTNPVTRAPVVTNITDGGFASTQGSRMTQRSEINKAMDLALSSGALTQGDYDAIQARLSAADTNLNKPTDWNEIYSVLSAPKANVLLNNMGFQVGEDADPNAALAEVSARQQLYDAASQGMPGSIQASNLAVANQAAGQGIFYPFTNEALSLRDTKYTTADRLNNIGTELGFAPDERVLAPNTQTPTQMQYTLPTQLGSYTRPTFNIDANYNPYALPTEQTTQYANPFQAGLEALTGYGGQIAYPVAAPTPLADQATYGYTRATLPDVGTPFDLAKSSTAKAEAAEAAETAAADAAAAANAGGARAGGLMSAYKKRMGKR